MARFGVLIFALAMVFSSAEGWGADENGSFTTHDDETCGYYLDAYLKSTLTGARATNGPYEAWGVFGWINGYLTAYNELSNNGKAGILGSMTANDARRWIASWCRDNPAKGVWDSVSALINKLGR